MKITTHTYSLLDSMPDFEYRTYEVENDADMHEFIRLAEEASRQHQTALHSDRISGREYAARKIRLFGFYKSYPSMFDVVVSNNYDHPMQFWKIELKELQKPEK